MKKKILLLGSDGQLGSYLNHDLAMIATVESFQYPEIDFLNPSATCGLISRYSPDIVINAVAFTDVDNAEDNVEKCKLINAITPGEIARLSSKNNSLFVHFSTDYIFDGMHSLPYTETDTPGPVNEYGRSKLYGENLIAENCQNFYIFRTSWLYSRRKESFVGKALAWSRNRKVLKIVDDQIGSPTSAHDLSHVVTQVLELSINMSEEWNQKKNGLYHLGGKGFTSRYNWVKKILDLDPLKDEQIVESLLPAKTMDFPTKAQRPLYTPLDCTKFEKAFGMQLPNWEKSLEFMLVNS